MTYPSPLKIDLLIIDNTKYHYFRFGKQNSHIFDFESFEREIVVNIDDFLHIGISVASYKYSKPKRFILFYFFLVSFIHLFYFDRNAIHMRMYPKWLHKALKLWFPIYLDEIKKNVQFSQQTFQRIYLEKTHTFSYVILFI